MIFGRKPKEHSWEEVWNERQRALEQIFGPAEDMVWHAPVPLEIGGGADVLIFKQHLNGCVYVTADLTGPATSQLLDGGEQYELVMCTRQPAGWAAKFLSIYAPITHEAVLQHLDTADMVQFTPNERMTKLAFTQFPTIDTKFDLFGNPCHLLLCVGLYKEEFEKSRAFGDNQILIDALDNAGVMPFTDPDRDPVTLLPPPSAAQ